MASTRTKHDGIFRTLRDDLGRGEHYRTIRRDYKALREFYIDEERQKKLVGRNIAVRLLYETWWMLKGLFYNLSPTRRLLLVLGLFLSVNHLTFQIGSAVATDNGFIGFGLLLFVLILELKDKLLAHDELESGRSIQRALMPSSCPSLEGWSVWFESQPAREVGGDLVDCIETGDSVGILLADVAGKGLRAALMSTKLQATVRALASENLSLTDLCSRVNSIFYRDSIKSIFASLLYVSIRPGDGKASYVNAGHLPPMVVTQNGIAELGKGRLALGLTPTVEYEENSVQIEPDGIFFCYTDGLTETCNEKGEQFGTERLMARLQQLRHLEVADIGETLLRNVATFAGEMPVADDLSMMILKRVPK